MTSVDDDRDPADVIAEEFAERLRRGERPSVSEYTARHPDLAEQLHGLLPAVAQMEQLKRFRRTPANDIRPDRLGDFRIVKEVGRGGMGVVFEAVQESLGRPVALKLLARHALLDPLRRSRFLREAQAAAKLHHTNIVPVFGVGEQDDLPYYVMQLIPGCGLHTLVDRWRSHRPGGIGASTVDLRGPHADTEPSIFTPVPATAHGPERQDWAFVARVGAETADALDYAHKQGVLHRDVKPANLLLDDAGRIWITDFGLAKQMHQDGLTATGDVVGTLQYLPPEFLHGQADARSDVYGLGATLYELLTLEPPFDATSPAGLMKMLADRDPTPPRTVNPRIPRDLETIVLKAMAREPARRYQSARALADDLEAFLDDRPIRARRTSALARGWRWCRRNPLVAASTATAAVAILFALASGWVGYVRTSQALEREHQKRDEAEQATAKFESNLQLSLDAFDELFRASETTDGWGGPYAPGGPGRGPDGPNRSPDGPGRPGRNPEGNGPPGGNFPPESPDKAVVLERVLAFYEKFAKQNSTNPRLQFEAAKAHRRVGELHNRLHQFEKAIAAFDRAVVILDKLRADDPDSAEILAESIVANAHSPDYPPTPTGRADAIGRWTKAVELGQHGANDDARITMPVADAYARLALAQQEAADRAGEEATYRAALKWLADRRVDAHGPPKAFGQARIIRSLVDVLNGQFRYAEAKPLLEASIANLTPDNRGFVADGRMLCTVLATQYQSLADVLTNLGDIAGATQATRLATQWNAQARSEPPRDGNRGPDNRGGPAGRMADDPSQGPDRKN